MPSNRDQTTACWPPHPECDGWHWLETQDGGCSGSYFWIASIQKWADSPSHLFTPGEMERMGWRYDREYTQ
jgi:hypothetical protein